MSICSEIKGNFGEQVKDFEFCTKMINSSHLLGNA